MILACVPLDNPQFGLTPHLSPGFRFSRSLNPFGRKAACHGRGSLIVRAAAS
jgi:hypothetical protein